MSKPSDVTITINPNVARAFPDAINETIRSLIRDNGSRIGAISFIKKDGTTRHLAFQNAKNNEAAGRIVGTERGAKASATRTRTHPNLLPVWDHTKQAWRSAALSRVYRVRVNGVTYKMRDKADIIV